jgi:hypothetical protein
VPFGQTGLAGATLATTGATTFGGGLGATAPAGDAHEEAAASTRHDRRRTRAA